VMPTLFARTLPQRVGLLLPEKLILFCERDGELT
jgi:hypothetical protein